MKNLMIYINPRKGFDDEHNRLAKIQIENSLNYWKKEDIFLVTNFPYTYQEVNAYVVNDDLYNTVHDKASKINTIIYLLENGFNEIVWFHDFDAFQLKPINIEFNEDLALTDYGWSKKWNTGSFFFKPTALDVFKWIKDAVNEYKTDEERALMVLTNENFKNINSRYQRLNITYNVGMRYIDKNLAVAEKPLKVAHFHPYRGDLLNSFKPLIPEKLFNLINEKSPNLY